MRCAAGNSPVWDGSGHYDDAWMRVDKGWRIVWRTCRAIGWTGNPGVQDPTAGLTLRLDLVALREEAQGGRIGLPCSSRIGLRVRSGRERQLFDRCGDFGFGRDGLGVNGFGLVGKGGHVAFSKNDIAARGKIERKQRKHRDLGVMCVLQCNI